ncbi:hypothetical protein [Streptomyces sp. NPDC051554]|uniref:hypothetical protein n=1 Tax=Streptomyces sp. NPDC051554 TaxID=3365656 RepID=UPI0037889498
MIPLSNREPVRRPLRYAARTLTAGLLLTGSLAGAATAHAQAGTQAVQAVQAVQCTFKADTQFSSGVTMTPSTGPITFSGGGDSTTCASEAVNGETITSAKFTITSGTLATGATCLAATSSGTASVEWKLSNGSTVTSTLGTTAEEGSDEVAAGGGTVTDGQFKDGTFVFAETSSDNPLTDLAACNSSAGLTSTSGTTVLTITQPSG